MQNPSPRCRDSVIWMEPRHLCLSSYSGESHHFKATKLSYPRGTNDLGGRGDDHKTLPKIPG